MFSKVEFKAGNFYNSVILFLKLALSMLAVYQLVLVYQLQVRFIDMRGIVNTTQLHELAIIEPKVTVSFYTLELFGSYKTLTVKGYITEINNVPLSTPQPLEPLNAQHILRKTPPLYHATFRLPPNVTPGATFKVAYEVRFDGRQAPVYKQERDGKLESYPFRYDPPGTGLILSESIPLTLRRGQRVRLPDELRGMRLRLTDGSLPFTVQDGVLRAEAGARLGAYRVSLASQLLVDSVDASNGLVLIGPPDSIRLRCSKDTAIFRHSGERLRIEEIQAGDRIAFVGPYNSSRAEWEASRVFVTSQRSSVSDVALQVVVQDNIAPGSAYESERSRSEVGLYTAWLFSGQQPGQLYWNLSRYIIDPDGQDPTTLQPTVRPRSMRLIPGTQYDGWFDLTGPLPPFGDYHLYVTRRGRQGFAAETSRRMEIQLIVNDELDRSRLPLTLVITEDVEVQPLNP